MSVEEILTGLVAIDSTSSRPNGEVVRHLAARAEGLGLSARLYPYTDERGVEKLQLVAVSRKDFEEDVLCPFGLLRNPSHETLS